MTAMIRLLRLATPAALVLLAGCSGATAPEECPVDLSYVRSDLVNPPEGVEMMLADNEMTGAQRLERTLTRPVDEMIEQSGGIEESIAGGMRHVEGYKYDLAHEDQLREEFRGYGRSEQWIDYYILSIEDGVTINQAFVDAVECRKRKMGT
jgi:hypothetical protein